MYNYIYFYTSHNPSKRQVSALWPQKIGKPNCAMKPVGILVSRVGNGSSPATFFPLCWESHKIPWFQTTNQSRLYRTYINIYYISMKLLRIYTYTVNNGSCVFAVVSICFFFRNIFCRTILRT